MKRFRFPLEKVAVVRQQETLRATERYVAARRASEEARQALERAREDRLAWEAGWEERAAGGPMPVREWLALQRQHEFLVQAERLASEHLQARLADLRTRRLDLEQARRREKALERLRERQEAAHRMAVLAEEQSELDEIGQVTWRRSEVTSR